MQKSRWRNWVAIGAFCAQMISEPAAYAGGWIRSAWRPSCVEKLAAAVDRLERYVDEHGSIAAKVPDVWGEERLTQHRYEFESQMADDVDEFAARVNATIRRADQAYLQSATTIQAAISQPTTKITNSSLVGGTKVEGNSTTTNPATTPPATTPPATTLQLPLHRHLRNQRLWPCLKHQRISLRNPQHSQDLRSHG